MTGLQLIELNNDAVKEFIKNWSSRNKATWGSKEEGKIIPVSVGRLFPN